MRFNMRLSLLSAAFAAICFVEAQMIHNGSTAAFAAGAYASAMRCTKNDLQAASIIAIDVIGYDVNMKNAGLSYAGSRYVVPIFLVGGGLGMLLLSLLAFRANRAASCPIERGHAPTDTTPPAK